MNLLTVEFSDNRIYGLDILRALAIFFVVYSHGTNLFSSVTLIHVLRVPIIDGVSIFFVLSGFLIGGILIKIVETSGAGRSSLFGFWKRRWWRTLPNYFLIFILVYYLFDGISKIDFVDYLLFLQNFNSPHPSFFVEAWSLSVEEWFYLLIPAGIFLVIKLGLKPKLSVLLVIVAIIVGSIGVRYYKFSIGDIDTLFAWDVLLRKQVLTRMDSIMFGVLGVYIGFYYRGLWLRYKKELLLIGIAVLVIHKLTLLLREPLGFEFNLYYSVFSFSLMSLGVLMLLPFLSDYKKGSGKLYRAVTVLSIISYSVYLIHLTLVQFYFLPKFLQWQPLPLDGLALQLLAYAFYWSLSIFGAIILYKYYEAPFTRLRDKTWFKS